MGHTCPLLSGGELVNGVRVMHCDDSAISQALQCIHHITQHLQVVSA